MSKKDMGGRKEGIGRKGKEGMGKNELSNLIIKTKNTLRVLYRFFP